MWEYLGMTILVAAVIAAAGSFAFRRLSGRGRQCRCGLGPDCPARHGHCNYAEPTAWPERLTP